MRSSDSIVAERLEPAGVYAPLEELALNELQLARQTNDLALATKNLSLLGKLYALRSEPSAAKMLEEAAECARECYGPNSLEEADELETLASVIARAGNTVGAAEARLKALAIRDSRVAKRSEHATTSGSSNTCEVEAESEDETLGRLNALCALAKFYRKQKQYEEAEVVFLRLVPAEKAFFGSTSKEVEELIPEYAEILKGLNRVHELKSFMHNDRKHGDRTADDDYHGHSKEVSDILKGAEEARTTDDLQMAISAHRDAVQKLQTIIDDEGAKLSSSYPFRELHTFQTALPQRFILHTLARLLRQQWGVQRDDKLLTEAANILRNLVENEHVFADGLHLMLTLSDLCSIDNNYEAELDELSLDLPKCTETLYTRALARFRKHGPTPETRKAMKTALKQNPYVPMAIAEPCEESEVPTRVKDGTRSKAAGYAYDAGLQWRTTPGALSFMFKTFGVRLPQTCCETKSGAPLPKLLTR